MTTHKLHRPTRMHWVISLAILVLVVINSSCTRKSEPEHKHEEGAATEQPAPDTLKKSIPKEEHAQVGNTHLMIKYHAPAVRGRTIWGGLVLYGEVWVTGAHNATSLETDKTIVIGDQQITAGKYALFTIPGAEKWTVIINRNWDQHLADEYDAKDDVVRVEITPTQMNDVQERLRYSITAGGNNNGTIGIRWEKIMVTIPFQLQ